MDGSGARRQRRSVRADHAVTGELEPAARAEAATGAVDAAVRGLLGDERVLDPAGLAPLVHANVARHDLKEAGGGAPPVHVGAEARAARVGDVPARVQHAAAVALATRPPPTRVRSAVLVEN